jgi:aryl-phospho-beta-D-glucosidase BglC (GH1 family)
MMKIWLLFLLIAPALCIGGPLVTFSAVSPITYEQIKLDSVWVQNVIQSRDTMLVGVTTFDLETWTRVAETPSLPARFVLTGNYPNGFEKTTAFSLAAPHAESLQIQVFNILGQQVLSYSQMLPAGSHKFAFNGGSLANGVYFLRATFGRQQQVIKMLKAGTVVGGALNITYLGAGAVSDIALAKSTTTDAYRFTGYAAGYVAETIEKTPQSDMTLQFELLPPKPADDFTSNWRGFNLLGFFTAEWDNSGYVEEDFQMISDFGFNFVRLPIDYRIYTKAGDWYTFLEPKLAQIDNAVAWGQEYGIHVSINLHRAPGYCVNPPSNPLPANQDVSLWNNVDAQQAFAAHWRMFAERYKDVPTEALSFNLVNEPGNVDAATYVKAVLPAIQAIREVSPNRIIISDAVEYGNGRIDEILAYNVVMSPHFYNPFQITHYKAEWVTGSDSWAVPTWPPRMVPNSFYGNAKSPWNTALIIQGQFQVGTVVTLHAFQVSSSADFRVNVGKTVIYSHDFRPGPGDGEWSEVIYSPEWNIYQNIYDRDYTFTLAEDAAELSFRVLSGDWMTWTELRFDPPAGSPMAQVAIHPGITDWGVP